MPAPLCLAAIVVGPPNDGIQKKPSVNSPFKRKKKCKKSALFRILHVKNLYNNIAEKMMGQYLPHLPRLKELGIDQSRLV